jgi:deferrochelatase/peroxidase EfeB
MADGTPPMVRVEKLLNNLEGIDFADPGYAGLLGELQGNVLTAHGKPIAHYFFVRFMPEDPNRMARLLGLLALEPAERGSWREEYPELQSGGALAEVRVGSELELKTRRVWELEKEAGVVDAPEPRALPFVATVMLSNTGYRRLGLSLESFSSAFQEGMASRGGRLNDPPRSEWDPGYRDREINALIIVAFDPKDTQGQDAMDALEELLESHGEIVCREVGATLRSSKQDPRTGRPWPIEPFGYRDGLSQPLHYQFDLDYHHLKLEGDAARATQSGSWRSFESLHTVLCADPHAQVATVGSGTYFVFRKLRQDIGKFYRQAHEFAQRSGRAEVDVRNDFIGRECDGTPLVSTDCLPGSGARNLNDFNYDSAANRSKCPLFAHARKVNRRAQQYNPHRHRIVRRAMPYGPSILRDDYDIPALDQDWNVQYKNGEQGEIGLLFLCAQSSIEHGFEHVQDWANETAGGLDPIAGQANGQHLTGHRDPRGEPLGLTPYDPPVDLLGGEYFFAPSLGFLKQLASR